MIEKKWQSFLYIRNLNIFKGRKEVTLEKRFQILAREQGVIIEGDKQNRKLTKSYKYIL